LAAPLFVAGRGKVGRSLAAACQAGRSRQLFVARHAGGAGGSDRENQADRQPRPGSAVSWITGNC